MDESVEHIDSAGQTFRTSTSCSTWRCTGSITRARPDVLLRQSGHDPAPTDCIVYVRGLPATVTRLA